MNYAILNFLLLLISYIGLAVTYLISLQPKKREERIGVKAWKQSKHLRTFGFGFEVGGIMTTILWRWFPIQTLQWKIFSNPRDSLILGICLAIPCIILLIVGVINAGKESWEPEKDGDLNKGIYQYIRHPQAIGEFPLFITIAIMVNSWFLVIILSIYNLIYLPIMVYVEETDLIRRFGDKYRKYQQETGMFFPKLR